MLLNFTLTFLYPFLLIYIQPGLTQIVSRPMTKLSWMLFLKKNFHIKLTLSGKKEDYANNISIQFDKWSKKRNWRRAYIGPSDRTAGPMRNRLCYRGSPGLGYKI